MLRVLFIRGLAKKNFRQTESDETVKPYHQNTILH